MIILNKCACGVLTNYGATCVNCSSIIHNDDEHTEIDVDLEALFTPDNTESEISAQPTSTSPDSPDTESDHQTLRSQEEKASHEKE